VHVVKVLQVDCGLHCLLIAPETVCPHCSHIFLVTDLSVYSNFSVNTYYVIRSESTYVSSWPVDKMH